MSRAIHPQKSLRTALWKGHLGVAQRQLNNGATLQADPAERVQLAVSAMGSYGLEPELIIQRWQWLAERGFRFPGAADDKVIGQILVGRPLGLVASWETFRKQSVTCQPRWIEQALARRDTAALEWWSQRGWSWPSHIEGSYAQQREEGFTVSSDLMDGQPLLLNALARHSLDATAHVAFLLSQGIRPLAFAVPGAGTPETPLRLLARLHRDLTFHQPEHVAGFRTMWVALVAAGEDPHARNAAGESALDLLRQTQSADWGEAWLRQAETLRSTAPERPRRRMRS